MSRWILALVGLAAAPLLAQIETGTLLGVVRDPSGAVVPGASVAVQSRETGIGFELTTNEAGRYQSPPLRPGVYDVTVQSAGFKQATAAVRVEVNQRVALDVTLEVGATTETVEVSAVAAQLETESSTLGNIRPEKAIAELPLNSRQFGQLIYLSPGVVPSFDRDAGGLPGTTRRGATNGSVNGMRPSNDYNSILIEGLDNTENHNGFGVAVHPPTDAIQEFKVQTSGADAQFGRAAGGFTNLVIKSGGQDFHGSLWHFHRNSEFDARNFFAAPGASTHFVMNQFGGTIGGPVVRDKTFFFAALQKDVRRQAQAFVSTVPSAAFKAGDFSALSGSLTDPVSRQPFPNKVVPASRFNPAGKAAIDLYPDPNRAGAANNYTRDPGRNYDQWTLDAKFDHYFSQQHSIVGRLSTGNTDIVEGMPLPPPAAGSVGPSEFPAHQVAFIDRYTISPSMLNEFRAGLTRVNMQLLQANAGDDVARRIGIPGVNTGDLITSGLPRINYAGFTSIGDDPFNPGILVTNNFQYEDILFWTRGKHSLRFGGRFDRRQYNAFQTSGIRGILNHSGVFAGNSIADGLLGGPINGNINILEGTRGFRRWDIGLFVQDDWKATDRLTINLGLRYEVSPNYPWHEVGDRATQFIPSTGELIRHGEGGVSRSGVAGDFNNWAPRVGLAYRLTQKTVLRTAYGIYYAYPTYEISRHQAINPPFAGAFAFVNNQNDFVSARKISEGFERTFNNPRSGLKAMDLDPAMPYVQQWNFNIQRELPTNVLLTLAYVGTKGVKMRDEVNLNAPPPGPGAVDPRRPYPQFNNIDYTGFFGNSNYNALQTTVEKRYSTGLSFLVNHTWGHNIDDSNILGGGHQNFFNRRETRGNSPYDTRHTFIATFNYELPFGRNASGGASKWLLAGWQTNGILRLSTGQFVDLRNNPNTLNGHSFQRPDLVAGCNPKLTNPDPARWFDTSCFTAPAQFAFGNVGRNTIEGPGTRQFDFSLFKNFALTGGERPVRLQLRGEVFNVTNTPQFNNPNPNIGTAQAGVVNTAGSPVTFQRLNRQVQIAAKLMF